MVQTAFTRSLVEAGAFAERPFVTVDVGALGGFNPRWQAFAPHLQMIGFDPQEPRQDVPGRTILPYAVGARREVRTMNLTRAPALSSFLPVTEMWKRRSCVFNELAEIVRQVEVETVGLDDICAETGQGAVDFIKIDTEGTELDVLKGAEGLLKSSVLGIETEFFFHETHQGRCTFADVDSYLRGQGFVLFDIKPWRYSKTALPCIEQSRYGLSPFGQSIGGDALYLRDVAADNPADAWVTPVEIAKLICLMELWDLPDCAVELLDWAVKHDRFLPGLAAGPLADLLVPPVMGRKVSLDFYRQVSDIFR